MQHKYRTRLNAVFRFAVATTDGIADAVSDIPAFLQHIDIAPDSGLLCVPDYQFLHIVLGNPGEIKRVLIAGGTAPRENENTAQFLTDCVSGFMPVVDG